MCYFVDKIEEATKIKVSDKCICHEGPVMWNSYHIRKMHPIHLNSEDVWEMIDVSASSAWILIDLKKKYKVIEMNKGYFKTAYKYFVLKQQLEKEGNHLAIAELEKLLVRQIHIMFDGIDWIYV